MLKDGPAAFQRADTALVAYTSGSTGEPRAVMLSHRSLLFQVGAMSHLCPGLEGDSQLSFLPLSHVAERCFSVYLALQHGAVRQVQVMISVSKFVRQDLRGHRITIMDLHTPVMDARAVTGEVGFRRR